MARHLLPTLVERTSRGEVTMDPYSKLLSDRIVFLGAPIDDTVANDVMAQFLYLEYDNPDRDISLFINSPGGSVTAMMAIYDTMRYVTADVQTVCLGQAASAAALLLAAGTPGKRLALPHARVVIHEPAMEASQGAAADLEVQANEILRMHRVMVELLARHSGRSADQVRIDIERDTVLTAEDAIAYGLVDELTQSRKLSQLAKAG